MPNWKRKTFFSISTRRLAESIEGLNSSLALVAGDLWPKKGRPVAAVEGPWGDESMHIFCNQAQIY